MKSERRHELQTNYLADWLTHKIETIRPYLNMILIAVALVALAAIVGAFVTGEQSTRAAVAWTDYFSAAAQSNPARYLVCGPCRMKPIWSWRVASALCIRTVTRRRKRLNGHKSCTNKSPMRTRRRHC
jgi:hypothetical protein